MPEDLADVSKLYADNKACAKLIGLGYVGDNEQGFTRVKRGKGFTYIDTKQNPITDTKIKKRLTELVIPPAWEKVWICPAQNGHILATGIDEKGRKQYIYHPTWRTMRDLLKFYRMIIFAKSLPKIRKTIAQTLERPNLDREKVLGTILWLLDNTYIRIGNNTYFEQNESVGLTTLSDKNLVIAGDVITLSFKGKSGKEQQITFEDSAVAAIITELIKQRGSRLFRYKSAPGFVDIDSSHVNEYLHEITQKQISAKDFRTWGGTLMAFNHLVETYKLPASKTPKEEKVTVQAIDAAANVLGNTRAVARSSYVHPDILHAYIEKNFGKYYSKAKSSSIVRGLDKRESELVRFLEQLFEEEFSLLKTKA